MPRSAGQSGHSVVSTGEQHGHLCGQLTLCTCLLQGEALKTK